ncbi:hypothetical protein N7499_009827 [Penicillium canescens]|nr:hypothetical protein N7499_009827 [Penicillium canescens]
MTLSQPGSAEKTIRKIDIAQVSLSLQDRLGLAKLKYQHGRLHGLNPNQQDGRSTFDSDKPSDSSSEFSRSPSGLMEEFLPAARILSWHEPSPYKPPPGPSFMSEATIPELSSPFPEYELDGGLLPSTDPSPKHMRLSRNDRPHHEDGADLLLYLANSPTPARIARGAGNQAFPPSTPPSQHAMLPGMTPTPGGGGMFANIGTPGQQFNFADFVNVTPSPAQPAWGGRTPGNPGRTPLTTKQARKRLNFDAIVPPSTSDPRMGGKETGLALQLGGELRP